MSVDGGYPRAITIPVPENIAEREIGDYVSNEVVSFFNELGTATVHRRSVSLSFLHSRLALLRFESHTQIPLSGEVRARYESAKAAFNSAPTGKRGESPVSEQDAVSPPAFNGKKSR